MLNLTILTDVNASEKKKANIQYSYPVAKVTKFSLNKYLLNFYGLNQNFSASVFDSYISGVCVNATFYRNKHDTGIEHNAELVLEHKTSNSQTFYVVIPINTGIESNLDNINSEAPVLELNSMLKQNSILYYQDTDDKHVFVFQNPISMANIPSSLQTAPMFNKSIKREIITTKTKKRNKTVYKYSNGFYYGFLTNAQNIKDEIECEYVTQTDTNVKPANRQMVSDIFVWSSITLGLILCLFYFLKLVNEKISIPGDAELIYKVIGGIGFLMLVIFIRLFTNTTTKKIQYGSITIFSLISIGLSLMAYNKVLF
jgi:hypothetical protein